jgi:hypothetical protein
VRSASCKAWGLSHHHFVEVVLVVAAVWRVTSLHK